MGGEQAGDKMWVEGRGLKEEGLVGAGRLGARSAPHPLAKSSCPPGEDFSSYPGAARLVWEGHPP